MGETRSLNQSEIEERLVRALKQFFVEDKYLLENDLNECTINHKLACVLQEYFPEWDVDCEYNKDGWKIKELELPKDKIDWNDTEAKSVFPDIIIHIRGEGGPNLLVIEVKKSSNTTNRTHDNNKLKAYTKEIGYICALFLEIGVKEKTGEWKLSWKKKDNFIKN